jgi:diacylglycerol O-acyltransferase
MPQQQDHDRLSWGDSVFLYLEREGAPLHIAGVSVLEGIVSLEDCIRFIESKIPQIPRYTQRAVPPLFNIGRPTWEFDPHFEVRNHIREATLKHGTESEFKALAGKILSQLMDRQRPLWDITLVRGLKGDRTGFITRIHHCLADGVAGVALMNVILGPQPVALPSSRKPRKFRVPPPRDPLTSVLDGWITSYANVVEQVLTAHEDVLRITERFVSGDGIPPADKLMKLLPELAAPTQALHFNVVCRGPQKVAWVEIPLAEIKAIKQVYGCSVNDVALALVTATIQRYALLHGDDIKGRLLRIMVPVNLRGNGSTGELGNQISIMPVAIPLQIRDPRKLLAAVHERMEFLKSAHVAELISLAGGLLGILPSALPAFAGPIVSQLPIAPFNLVCTNVPGPDFPLYLMGHKMLNWYPYVPVGGDMALNCAMLSYSGMVYFGFSGDAHAVPDLVRLEKFLKLSMQELRKTAGSHPRRKKHAPPKGRTAAAAAAAPAETIQIPALDVASLPEFSPKPGKAAEATAVLAAEVA